MAVLPVVLLMCAVSVGHLGASPLRTYDQRQQGELNIHAQLDNIVIVLVPSSSFDLFGLKGVNKFGQKPDKDEILQFLQKPMKNDIDRYEVIKDENDNDIKDVSVLSSDNVGIVQQGNRGDEKEEEVVATVEEMKPEATVNATDLPKLEATENSSIKEHSTVSETVQELVFNVSSPDELKNKTEPPQETKPFVLSKEPETDKSSQNVNDGRPTESKVEPNKETTVGESTTKKEESTEKKSTSSEEGKGTPEYPSKKLTIEDLIKPVAAKEEKSQNPAPSKTLEEPITPKKTSSLVEGARREKVIRYKADTKWAPGLVDMLAAPRAKPTTKEVEEKQRFAALCAPGTWDIELKTCIMPGETRSRHELARFLEAMRFGIAIPVAKQQ